MIFELLKNVYLLIIDKLNEENVSESIFFVHFVLQLTIILQNYFTATNDNSLR